MTDDDRNHVPDADQRHMDEFISIVAHDLRTPLTSIRGYAQLMLRQRRGAAADGDADALAQSLGTIIDQADRLAEKTEELLEVSRIRLRRMAFKPSQVDLAAAVRAAAAALPGVRVDLHVPDAGPTVNGDSTRLQRALSDVLSFLAAWGGSEPLAVHVSAHDAGAVLVAEGGGEPLSAEETTRLLYELVRPTDTSGGWRLANVRLFIARGVAEAHGGSLEVQSPAPGTGRGISLTLTLPVS